MVLAVACVGMLGSAVYAQSVPAGGRLYDNWWEEAGVDSPTGDQPLWATQSSNTRSGSATWRCKECHGWDYAGVDGVYGSGSHQTGFAGLLESASTMTAETLQAWLDGTTNADHDFSAMGESGMSNLVTFLREGMIDVTPFINGDKTLVGADKSRGETLFGNACASCHGPDGKLINFSGDDDDPEYVGTVASDNPWELMHKIRLGQPGTAMPAGTLLGWTTNDMVDVLAYAQTLPVNNVPTAIAEMSWAAVKKGVTGD